MSGNRIRPAVDDDLEAICALSARVYPDRPVTPERVASMKEVLFSHPWRDERLPSLVYEKAAGEIGGFLGVMPRRMKLGSRAFHAAISHRFMVDPASRGSLAGLDLVKMFLAGPQDLSITEPENPAARQIFERYGAFGVEAQSLEWNRPVRPFGWATLHARGRLPRFLRGAAAKTAAVLDASVGGIGGLRPRAAPLQSAALTPESMLETIDRVARSYALRPVHDVRELRWLLDRLEHKHSRGALRGHFLTSQTGAAVGFYLYYARTGGTGLVANVCARPDQLSSVWGHLIADAWGSGTVALRGKYDAIVARVSDRALFVRRSPHTFLLQTNNRDVEQAVVRGDAFLTRLEGEGGIPFGDTQLDSTQKD